MSVPPSIVAVGRAVRGWRRAGAGRSAFATPARHRERSHAATFSTGTPSARSSAPRRSTPGASPPTTRGCRWRRTTRTAISILMRLDPLVVRGLRHGPTQDYQQEYLRVNVALDDATGTLVDVLSVHGHAAERRAGHHGRDQRRHSRSRTRRRPPRRAWAGSARRRCSSRRSSAPPSAWPPSSPTSNCRPASPSRESRCGACRELRRRLPRRLRPRRAVAAGHGARAPLRRRRLPPPHDALHRRRGADLRHLHRRLPVRAAALTRPAGERSPGRPRRAAPSASRLHSARSSRRRQPCPVVRARARLASLLKAVFTFRKEVAVSFDTAQVSRGARRPRPSPHAPAARRARRHRRGRLEPQRPAGVRRGPRALPRARAHHGLPDARRAGRDRAPCAACTGPTTARASCPRARRTATPSSAAGLRPRHRVHRLRHARHRRRGRRSETGYRITDHFLQLERRSAPAARRGERRVRRAADRRGGARAARWPLPCGRGARARSRLAGRRLRDREAVPPPAPSTSSPPRASCRHRPERRRRPLPGAARSSRTAPTRTRSSRRRRTCEAVAGADLVIVNGGGLEGPLLTTLENAGGDATIVDASAGSASRTPQPGEPAARRRRDGPALLARPVLVKTLRQQHPRRLQQGRPRRRRRLRRQRRRLPATKLDALDRWITAAGRPGPARPTACS